MLQFHSQPFFIVGDRPRVSDFSFKLFDDGTLFAFLARTELLWLQL
uniref:Uncharacterized protein n=1 Tax=Arundo donax TaxID=35708 RepID=A0A0A8YR63_ARUDO